MMHIDWVEFYSEFATKLLLYKNDRQTLIKKIQKVYSDIGIKFPKMESDNILIDIDPFSIFGMFNKNITNTNRTRIANGFATEFGITATVPKNFDGISVLNNLHATFYFFKNDRGSSDIENLWELFEAAITLSDDDYLDSRQAFSIAYNTVLRQQGIRWNITMGLYWIRPYTFMSLDAHNRWYIRNPKNMPAEFVALLQELDKISNAEEYLTIRDACAAALQNGRYPYKSFPELSYFAWIASEKTNQKKKKQKTTKKEDKTGKNQRKAKITYPAYTKEDFLKEVYLPEEGYNRLVCTLRMKKNVILQGAPGVGKTFVAERLAYSLMGVKDTNRVKMVQFHQSYSYEDFMMGFRPSASGFELKKGVFYHFCKKAETDAKNDYFFLIDEINRGNLSKIFGELFMLIEKDKRGISVPLLYSEENFSVPENLYMIGMMNTADRSLAILDYALRRRFSFVELKPGFDTQGFRAYKMSLHNSKFDKLIHCITSLNAVIASDESLGEGFCIGHSYFCNMTSETATTQNLEVIIEYEIIPLLKEYWFDEQNKVRDWSNKLRSAIQ